MHLVYISRVEERLKEGRLIRFQNSLLITGFGFFNWELGWPGLILLDWKGWVYLGRKNPEPGKALKNYF